MIEQTVFQWVVGIVSATFGLVLGHIHWILSQNQLSMSALGIQIDGVRRDAAMDIDKKMLSIRDEVAGLRVELNEDRRERAEARSKTDQTMVTRAELTEQINRVLGQLDRNFKMFEELNARNGRYPRTNPPGPQAD